jgi:hypothetical protein
LGFFVFVFFCLGDYYISRVRAEQQQLRRRIYSPEEEEFIRLPWLVGRVVGPLLAARALPLRCAQWMAPSYFCLSHARTVFSCGAPCCNPAHRDGMGSGG